LPERVAGLKISDNGKYLCLYMNTGFGVYNLKANKMEFFTDADL